ncbi:substrate-specific activator of APC-dependent proteolysis [Cryptotrichosporon argae]
MSIYDTEFSRRIRASVPTPPGSPQRNTPTKGKSRDYGDRFIPQREEEMHAAFQFLVEKPKSRRRSGQGTDSDARREEVNTTFTNLLKMELLTPRSSTSTRTRQSFAPVATNHAASHAGATPMHHHPPPGVSGAGGDRESSPASTLPPLPLHAPSTPTSAHGRAPGSGPSSAHHRAHQSQIALTSGTPPRGTFSSDAGSPGRKRVLNFASPTATRMAQITGGLDDMGHERYSLSPVGRESQKVLLSPRKNVRQIARTPFKVLDAPELADDFYLNLVSWSASNVLGVGLNACVYLWSAQTSTVTKLCDLADESDSITGLEWTNRGSTLALGTTRGVVEIWDAEYCKRIRTMTGHTQRVGSLAWNNHVLSSGSRDRSILHRDVRMPDPFFRRLAGAHKQEVCGLKWNQDTDQLASGGNDNKLYIWGGTENRPTWRFGEHRAAVKAIAWSPHQRGVLASGGGTQDKKIRFWNTLTGGLINEYDTGSQVCNLMWSRNSNELVSTHGYSAGQFQNQIHIWSYPSMKQVASLTGHTYRVLYLAMSPDGQTIVTGAGDETLRFWNAFEKGKHEEGITESPVALLR